MIQFGYQKVTRTVRRALAFETSRFLKYTNPKDDEARGPYRSWAEGPLAAQR
jgi:hypothetical protein